MSSLCRTETLCEQHNKRKDATSQNDPMQIAALCKRAWKPKNDNLFEMESILFKMTVVNHASCSFLPLLAAEGEDTQSRMGLMFIHFPHFNKTSPIDETQNRRRKVFISESKVEAIEWVKECITHTHAKTHTGTQQAHTRKPWLPTGQMKKIKIQNVISSGSLSGHPLAAGLICQVYACECVWALFVCLCSRQQQKQIALSSRPSMTRNRGPQILDNSSNSLFHRPWIPKTGEEREECRWLASEHNKPYLPYHLIC